MQLDKDVKWGAEKLRECIKILKKEYPKLEFELKDDGNQIDRELSGDILVHNKEKEITELWAIKFRRLKYKSFGDVTVEYKNAVGTKYENKGDWFRFKGGIVQKYVYGWSNGEKEFIIIDLKKCKWNKEKWFGAFQNKKHGKSTFYAIPLSKLKEWGSIIKTIKIKEERKDESDGKD